MLIIIVGVFVVFSLMIIVVGMDYWLYFRGVCRIKFISDNEISRKNEEVMIYLGLWRICCLEGICKFFLLVLNNLVFDILMF